MAATSSTQGTLPSNTEKNPKEQVQAITLRSGKELEDKPKKEKEKEEERKAPIIDLVEGEEVKPYVPPVPFPQRLKKTQDDQSFMKFLDIFKKLQINIPFAEALAQMPSYAKFLKEILSKKRKIDDQGMVKLTEECSAIIQNKLPPKLKDPGSFSIPCMGELKPKRMSLQFTIGRPINQIPQGNCRGRTSQGREGSLILGRPFLATARALIDVNDGKLTLRVGQEEVVFDVLKSCKLPMDYDVCFRIDVIDKCVENALHSVDDNENKTEEKEKKGTPPKQELKQLPPHPHF
ncbi:uncharacterized protein LOC105631608 [Jatropha curcas]|uniref:uncharacterized protein LOC105631608 n=1 Tax=Jatropha curcas TaxID=180498 RepID=UPI00189508A2|nr:uncharacterized protein LOC105631608 [Jatropha curcas]